VENNGLFQMGVMNMPYNRFFGTLIIEGANETTTGADDWGLINWRGVASGEGWSAESDGTLVMKGGLLRMDGSFGKVRMPQNEDFTFKLNSGRVNIDGGQSLKGHLEIDDAGATATPQVAGEGFHAYGTGNTTWNGGLTVVSGGTLNLARSGGTVTVAAGSTLTINQGGTVNIGGSVDPLSDTGNSVIVVNNSTASLNINAGTKQVDSLTGTGKTTVADGATLKLKQHGSSWSKANAQRELVLNASGTTGGTLDLTNNKITFDITAMTETAVMDMVKNAYHAGAWDQPGILSSTLGAGDRVGVRDLTANDVTAAYTRGGDATLDGTVTLADFNNLFNNFGQSGKTWDEGDFQYDGTVTLADFNILFNNFGTSISSGGAEVATEPVPEPTTLALLALGGAAVLWKRRRR
jgi:hypothetical protein